MLFFDIINEAMNRIALSISKMYAPVLHMLYVYFGVPFDQYSANKTGNDSIRRLNVNVKNIVNAFIS